MNTYWYTNFAAYQEPHQEFHYYLTSYEGIFDAAKAERFSRQTIRRPVAFYYPSAEKGEGTIEQTFLQVESKNIILESLYPNREGNGVFLRLRECNGRKSGALIRLFNENCTVFQADPIGRPMKEIARSNNTFAVEMEGHSMASFVILMN
jgi:alpha-mannosidase